MGLSASAEQDHKDIPQQSARESFEKRVIHRLGL